jgi:RND family efflux transporter MFP subunit
VRRIIITLALVVAGCGERPRAAAPAVEKPKAEGELAYTTLSKDAYKSLAIDTREIATRPVQEYLPLTGWITAKQGNEVAITAPTAGYVRTAPELKRSVVAGERIDARAVLFVLEPVLNPVEQIQLATLKRSVDSELTKARSTLKLAQSEYDRVRELHDKGLRGQQELDLAKKNFDHAREDVQAALDKQGLFERTSINIAAPQAGAVLAVHVSPGQYVAAAAPLITLIDLEPPWVRVPVPEFDFPGVERRQAALVTLKQNGSDGTRPTWQAKPVALAPVIDTQRHTADLIYELAADADKPGGPAFVKDQMVTVQVPLGSMRPETVAPYSALVFDAHGGAWIYLERTPAGSSAHRFVRQRVEVGPVVSDGVVLRPAFKAPQRVVTAGAGVLFSREFHKPPAAGKSAPVEDDD